MGYVTGVIACDAKRQLVLSQFYLFVLILTKAGAINFLTL
jgi:hypothetical protein